MRRKLSSSSSSGSLLMEELRRGRSSLALFMGGGFSATVPDVLQNHHSLSSLSEECASRALLSTSTQTPCVPFAPKNKPQPPFFPSLALSSVCTLPCSTANIHCCEIATTGAPNFTTTHDPRATTTSIAEKGKNKSLASKKELASKEMSFQTHHYSLYSRQNTGERERNGTKTQHTKKHQNVKRNELDAITSNNNKTREKSHTRMTLQIQSSTCPEVTKCVADSQSGDEEAEAEEEEEEGGENSSSRGVGRWGRRRSG